MAAMTICYVLFTLLYSYPFSEGSWWSDSIQLPFKYSSGGSFIGAPYRGVLLATESSGYYPSDLSYYTHRNPPHFTVVMNDSIPLVYQHYPITEAARGLAHAYANRYNAIQIALAWSSSQSELMPNDFLGKVAELMRWIESQTDIKRYSIPFYQSNSSLSLHAAAETHRMSVSDWYLFNGWCGHQHVPWEKHIDPGLINITFLLNHKVPAHSYEIQIFTGQKMKTGTAGSISISLSGQWDFTENQTIIQPDSFSGGDVAFMRINTTRNLGNLTYVRLSLDSADVGDGWFVEKVVVTQNQSKLNGSLTFQYTFPCERWFAGDKDDGLTSRVLSFDGPVRLQLPTGNTQESVTVGNVADGLSECDTSTVLELSHQIMHQLHCDRPSAIDSISSFNQLCITSSTIPYLQREAATSLAKTVTNKQTASFKVISAFRTIAEQYVMYQWGKNNRCGYSVPEEKPGMSKQMEGFTVSVHQSDYSKLVALIGSDWVSERNSTDITFNGTVSVDVQKESILSFQKLWNLNNPNETITANGIYTETTEKALRKTSASGFRIIPSCSYSKPVVPCCLAGKSRGTCRAASEQSAGKWKRSLGSACNHKKSEQCVVQSKIPAAVNPADRAKNILEIELATRSHYHGGSNGDATIQIFGDRGTTGKVALGRVWGDDVVRAAASIHLVSSAVEVGEIQAIEVGHSTDVFGRGWYLQNITVHQTSPYVKRRYVSICSCWLDSLYGQTSIVLHFHTRSVCTAAVDVLQPGGSGKLVVDTILRMITNSHIFQIDYGFLRKLAWVESRFGLNNSRHLDNGQVGIWNFLETQLAETKNTTTHPGLKEVHQNITDKFGIDWTSTILADIHKPLFAGLGANILLSIKPHSPPVDNQPHGQYWKKYFWSQGLSETQFLDDAKSIPPISNPEEICTTETLHEERTVFTETKNNDTVSDFIGTTSDCSLHSSYGLSLQIIQQMECNKPGTVQSLATLDQLCLQSSCFPFLSSRAVTSLREHLNSSLTATFTVIQAMMPLPYQYIKSALSNKSICSAFQARSPRTGEMPFERGAAIQVAETEELKAYLSSSEWEMEGIGEKYFKFLNGSDIVVNQVRAFQQLWNANNPTSLIPISGRWDQMTEEALKRSPVAGFPSGSSCNSIMDTPILCCTGDKKKGACIAPVQCFSGVQRSGYCSSSITNSVCCTKRQLIEVLFPSGIKLSAVNLPLENPVEYEDPYNTGTHLFRADTNRDLQLSTNFKLGEFVDPLSSYFRLDPLLVGCMQRTRNQAREEIIIDRCYVNESTATTVLGNASSIYRTGKAAVIRFKDRKRELSLTKFILSGCLGKVRMNAQDLVLYLLPGAVHVELGDTMMIGVSPQASYSKANYVSWIHAKILEIQNEVIQPSCSGISPLSIGSSQPSATITETCGKIDQPIHRYSEDFKKLVQVADDHVAFANEERLGTWCGRPGRRCLDCRTAIVGSSQGLRCADRMMTERLADTMVTLGWLVEQHYSNKRKLLVLEAWDEPTSDFTNGLHNKSSLHYEGRTATISVTTELHAANSSLVSDTSQAGKLSALAVCAGFDHVWYRQDEAIQVSVRKAEGVGTMETYANSQFLCVLPPASQSALYTIPDNQYDLRACLHDSDNSLDHYMTQNLTLRQFLSGGSFRYFRLHPMLAESAQMIEFWMDKYYNATVDIIKSYEVYSELSDSKKMHSYGQGIEISTRSSVADLASVIVETAGHMFRTEGLGFGTELGTNSVYYQLQASGLDTWVKEGANMSGIEYHDFVTNHLQKAVYVIDPTNDQKSCMAVPPTKQSPYYQWRPSQWKNRGERVLSVNDTACQTTSSILFCTNTEQYREKQVELLWTDVSQHHFLTSQVKVKREMTMCLKELCGKCYKGELWENKTEHCSNFLHWAPLSFSVPENSGSIFSAINQDTRTRACTTPGYKCIEQTEVFSVLAPRLSALYPIEPKGEAKEKVYSPANNPSPVYDIMQEIFAMSLEGRVTVWVKDRTEISSLRQAIKALMVYNTKITKISFYTDAEGIDTIRNWIDNNVIQWKTTTCLDHGRRYITDYLVEEMPQPQLEVHTDDIHSQLYSHELEWLGKV